MTRLLEKAFKEASKLPVVEQNELAKWMLEELKAEKKWEQIFAKSEDVLDQLADEALEADKKGKTRALDIDIPRLCAIYNWNCYALKVKRLCKAASV